MAGDSVHLFVYVKQFCVHGEKVRYGHRVKPLQSFGKLLRFQIDKSCTNQRELARKSGFSLGLLQYLLKDERTPPLDCLTQLADSLGLDGQDRQAFTQAAHLAHAPGEVRALVNHLRLESAKSRQETSDLGHTVYEHSRSDARA